MAAKEPFEIPVGMRSVCLCFERWRNGQKACLPIPEALAHATLRTGDSCPEATVFWTYRETLARLSTPTAA